MDVPIVLAILSSVNFVSLLIKTEVKLVIPILSTSYNHNHNLHHNRAVLLTTTTQICFILKY